MKDLVIFGIGLVVGVTVAIMVARNAADKYADYLRLAERKSLENAPPQDSEIRADRL